MRYKRIRVLIEDHDLTQKEICIFLSCSQRVYSNYEIGNLNIPIGVFIKIANYYDVSVDYILGRTDKNNIKVLLALN